MKKSNIVSISEYARICRVSRTAIQKAIKSGRINKGYDSAIKKIIVDEADKEYGYNAVIKKTNEKLNEKVSQERLEELSNIPVSEIKLNSTDSANEADRKLTIIKAQRDLLKLKTESGELVNRDAVYKELYEHGKEIRLSLQAIPDRIIDQVISLERNAAHKMMSEAISEVLLKLSNVK